MPYSNAIAQFGFNCIVAASDVILIGIGFSLVYRTARFFAFSQAIILPAGAYLTLFLHATCGLPLGLAAFVAVALSGALGATTDLAVYCPLRRKGASPLTLLLSSIGIYIITQNLISAAFGDSVSTLRSANVEPGLLFFGARVSIIRLLITATSVFVATSTYVFLKFTWLGKELRAVGNANDLAEIVGIRTNRVILIAFSVSSALTGLAGVLIALDIGMWPTMGISPFLMGVIAVIIVGRNDILAVAGGAILVAVAQQGAVWFLGSAWSDTITFSALLAVLLLRPAGLFNPTAVNR
jgi:branched-chain amino acid transport system permease protein